ncbi:MAG: methionyl-tRNA formyltransferase [Candidatus Magasanikbacteria bacterium]|nr:methionyl-tRNA formyltransferase [Candidatus Magasanikbacteria bacterium]
MIKVVFYGTDNFAKTILNNICKSADFKILCVITRPDKPSGRNREVVSSPVKILAEKNHLEICQPEILKEFDLDHLHNADLAIVAEYGLIIPERLLNFPKFGTVNLHGSILPKYRGASPIQTAILNGDSVTGVTLMLMDKKMDHGPIISGIQTPIDQDELFTSLYLRLSNLASELFLKDIVRYLNGEIKPIAQDDSLATYCKILSRDDGKIDFSKNAITIYNQYRAFTPWPGVWAMNNKRRIKFDEISIAQISYLSEGFVNSKENRIFIGCGQNSAIEIKSLQIEGKKMLPAVDFLRGERDFGSARLN